LYKDQLALELVIRCKTHPEYYPQDGTPSVVKNIRGEELVYFEETSLLSLERMPAVHAVNLKMKQSKLAALSTFSAAPTYQT